jgi:hypothetical protein
MKTILSFLFLLAVSFSILAQQDKVLSIYQDGLVIYRIPVAAIDSMNFNNTSNFLTREQLENAPVNMMDLLVQFNLSSTNHDSFGFMAILHATDLMSEDIAMDKLSHFQFDYLHENNRYDYRRTNMIWKYFSELIYLSNKVIDTTPVSTPNPAFKNSLGHAYAMRAMANYYLLQLYQFTGYYDNPANLSLPSIPLIYAQKEPLFNQRNYKVPASEVIAQCEADYIKAKEYITENRASKTMLNQHVVDGLLARLYLLSGNWTKAIDAAISARNVYPLMDANGINDGFMNIHNPEWIWGYEHTVETSTLYASFFSHISNRTPGYAGLNYAPRYIDKRLYQQISSSDLRKNWFQDETGSKTLHHGVDNNATTWRYPYASLKFGFEEGFTQDYVYMRSAEMYLIEAEALLRLGRDTDALNVMNTLLSNRNPGNPLTSITLEEILLQRRIELWGEGFAYFDLKRLNKGMDRTYTESNHATTAKIAVPANSERWNYEFPRSVYDQIPDMTDTNKMPDFKPKNPVVLSGTAIYYECELENVDINIYKSVGVQVTRNPNFTSNISTFSTNKWTGTTFSDTLKTLNPETNYYLRYFYQSKYGVSYSSVMQFTTTIRKIPTVELIIDSIGIDFIQLKGSYQFENERLTDVLETGFEVALNENFNQGYRPVAADENFVATVDKLLADTEYYIRSFVTTIDGKSFSPSVKITTQENIVNPSWLDGKYQQTDYNSDGSVSDVYETDITIMSANHDGTLLSIHNFWEGGDFTIYAQVNYDAKTFTIAPQVIYKHDQYGDCKIFPFDVASNTIDRSGNPVHGIIEEDGSLTVGSWAAMVNAGAFGRYLKSSLIKQESASAPSLKSKPSVKTSPLLILQEESERW